MCPLCLSTAAIVALSAVSAGSAGTLALKVARLLRSRSHSVARRGGTGMYCPPITQKQIGDTFLSH
jgi:hypothetical protein